MTTSCDPCAGVVCNNGTCSNGTCLCLDGYVKDHNKCIGYNEAFAGVDMQGSQYTVDTFSNSNLTQAVVYTIVADPANPYKITLNDFNSISDNDITFSVSTTNTEVLLSESVTTLPGNTYMISGARTGSQIQLQIEAPPRTHTVTLQQP